MQYDTVKDLVAAVRKHVKDGWAENSAKEFLAELGVKKGRKYPDVSVEEFVTQAVKLANEKDLCGDFDRILEAVGLTPRQRHRAVVKLTVEVEVDVWAHDEAQALKVVPSRAVGGALYRLRYDLDEGSQIEVLSATKE